MKFLVKIMLLALLPAHALTQDSAAVITSSMYNKSGKNLSLSNLDGWIFSKGNDSNWSKENLVTTGWEKLKPTDLTKKYADKNGRLQGWFRIKLKIDSELANDSLALKGGTWAAADFYLNGKLIFSQGNTGINGKPYHENDAKFITDPVEFESGHTYILAIHILDYVSQYPPHVLKSSDPGLKYLISITERNDNTALRTVENKLVLYNIIWITAIAVLSFLFWLLYFLNRNEKNLLYIAILSTLFGFLRLCIYHYSSDVAITFNSDWWFGLLINVIFALIGIFVILIFVSAFKRHITKPLKIFMVIISLCLIIASFTTSSIETFLAISAVFEILVVILYYIYSSWSTLKGAQWAIVVGLLLFIFFAALYIVIINYLPGGWAFYYISTTVWVLSLPLVLLVYVSLRFKEILKEVRVNAEAVIKLSEEKKDQAIQQQEILQKEVERQTHDLRKTLDDLKSTQKQLIQSEKMASLGELTAGIAHEIQNPLNFVNNFSDINKEMIEELRMRNYELKIEDPEIKELLNDIEQNSEKINHHGKRADAIVKGMLQHSRASSGKKEPTDINALCDEYFRLSYHGMRAKDKNFICEMKTDFDKSIGKINIVPQDIGRVILNLINNAFYACAERSRSTLNENEKLTSNSYQPIAEIKTRKVNDTIEIRVIDNGNGIPEKIKDKIFQPFFTTKPTGSGTGLGLSLSYDIVKAHGGEIRVNSKEGEGTEFTIQLPAS